MKKITKLIRSPWVQTIVAWLFIFNYLGRILKFFFSMSQDNIIMEFINFENLLLALVAMGLIFSLHAYSLVKKNKKGTQTLPIASWLTGLDVIEVFNVSWHQLLQHIYSGLPAYSEKTDIRFEPQSAEPMSGYDINWEFSGTNEGNEYKIGQCLFRKEDIESFMG